MDNLIELCNCCGEDVAVEGGGHEVKGDLLCLDCYGDSADEALFGDPLFGDPLFGDPLFGDPFGEW